MFNEYIIYLIFLIIYIGSSNPLRNKDLVVSSTGIKEIYPSTIGLQFYSILNNTSDQDYFVELITDQCCIDSGENLDCDSIEIIGECSQIVQKGNTKAFTMVAPVLDPHQRKGYCVIHMDSRPIDKRNKIIRDVIKIEFDTAVSIKNNNGNLEKIIKNCQETDLDPLNECKPVDCDTHYNGKKPLFDKHKKRCSKPPKCENSDSEIFDPVSNQCINGESVDNDDIDIIKMKIKREQRERIPKDVIIVETNGSNNDSINGNIFQNANIMNDTKVKKEFHSNLLQYILTNKYTLCLMVLVIFIQCLFICTMVYCLSKKRNCNNEKPVERKYFNYRQDVSVTTPLIGTSNIDTDTIDFDYVSESNVDKKIKCYKACQKKIDNGAKISLSDDILSKCLTRRDWNSKPKSDTNELNTNAPTVATPEWHKKTDNYIKKQSAVEQTVEKDEGRKTNYADNVSERVIQCHDYNVMETETNFLGSQCKAPSISIEKEAQACFSNDSVDDFLSERGLIFIAGDDLSKNSFGSNSTTNSEIDRSSKTSKNNIKKVFSQFFKKVKVFTNSDPGAQSSEKSLELLHMSKQSMFSSSASGYKHIKGAKCPKESRSSIF